MSTSSSPVDGESRRKLVIHGVFWNGMLQIFVAGVSFISMLILVRLIPPAEYGRAATVTGILALVNCFNCSYFLNHAIQLGERESPDWDLHWRVSARVQIALSLICNLVAGVAWCFKDYQPIAPLLHFASIGVLVDAPSQLSQTIMRRDMDFRRMRLVNGVGVLLTASVSIGLGLRGAGAYAMIIGANVVHGLPYGLDLLVLRRWRPRSGWLAAPDWSAYRGALKFGAQGSGAALLAAARGFLESIILPRGLGYEIIGLLNRAQVLFATTFARVNNLILDAVYPVLPRSAHDRHQFARHATLVAQIMSLIIIPGTVFVALEGVALSRVLYGEKWAAADPFVLPGTVFAGAGSVNLLFAIILLAANRLKTTLVVNVCAACLSVPAMITAAMGGGATTYIWALAAGQCAATAIAVRLCSPLLVHGWFRQIIMPPIIIGIVDFAALWLGGKWKPDLPPLGRCLIAGTIYATVTLVVLRFGFPSLLRLITDRMPGGRKCARWLRLR